MASVGIRALKQNASAVVARAAAGEIVTITDRGRPVAQLTPLNESRIDRMIASGRATRPTRPLSELPDPVEVTDGPSLSEILAEMRAAER